VLWKKSFSGAGLLGAGNAWSLSGLSALTWHAVMWHPGLQYEPDAQMKREETIT
jgi:hypothetical protein